MLATSARLHHDDRGGLLLTLYSDEGSSICAALAPEIVPDIAAALLDEVLAGTADLRMARDALAQDASRTTLHTASRLAADLVWRYAAAIDAVARAILDGGSIDGKTAAAIVAAHTS